MRRTLVVLCVVLLAVLLFATPGLVAARGGHGGASFHIYGKIADLDTVAATIDVLVETPASLTGETVTVQTTDATRFKECDDGTSYRIDFDDLVVGRQVRIAGTLVEDAYFANSIIQYVP